MFKYQLLKGDKNDDDGDNDDDDDDDGDDDGDVTNLSKSNRWYRRSLARLRKVKLQKSRDQFEATHLNNLFKKLIFVENVQQEKDGTLMKLSCFRNSEFFLIFSVNSNVHSNCSKCPETNFILPLYNFKQNLFFTQSLDFTELL